MPELIEDRELLSRTFSTGPSLIQDFLWEGARAMLVGKPGVSKSILSLQLASCLAGGHGFLQWATPQARNVLYVSGEGNLVELQARRREIDKTLPTLPSRLYHWALPDHVFNSPKGLADLLEAAEAVKPSLLIIDPLYATFEGPLEKTEFAGAYVRNLNRFQERTGSAAWIVHHSHRPSHNPKGEEVQEENPYLGNVLFEAWPQRMWVLRGAKGDKWGRELACTKDRAGLMEGERWRLTFVEPSPLLFVLAKEGWTSAMWGVWFSLKSGGPATQAELEERMRKSHGAVNEAVGRLVGMEVVEAEGYPKRYRV